MLFSPAKYLISVSAARLGLEDKISLMIGRKEFHYVGVGVGAQEVVNFGNQSLLILKFQVLYAKIVGALLC